MFYVEFEEVSIIIFRVDKAYLKLFWVSCVYDLVCIVCD